MSQLSCSTILLLAASCGDSGGSADAGPEVDGGTPADPSAEGQFVVGEVVFGEDGESWGSVYGTIVSPRIGFHSVVMEQGDCRLSTYEPGDCGPDYCEGICAADGACVPYPTSLSAGTVEISGLTQLITIPPSEYGYYPSYQPAAELFAAGDPIVLSAAGGAVPAFELASAGVSSIQIPVEPYVSGDPDATLRIEDGADLELEWGPVEPGARVRLSLLTNNRGHGFPVDAMIECDVHDTGELVVPRAMIEAFPEKPYQYACAGSDCPTSSLVRYRAATTTAGDHDIELRVESQFRFMIVHP